MNSTTPEILPPAKRRTTGKVETSLFLDSIPEEVLEIVLRFLSSIPYAKNWEIYVDVRDLVQGFGVGGGFGNLYKSRFHMLVVSGKKNFYDKYGTSRWREPTEPYLWTNDIAIAQAYVVAGGGEALRTLVIDDGNFVRRREGDLADVFVNHCPNVTSLSIGLGVDPVWTNKFGSQLESLEVFSLREFKNNIYYDNSDILRTIGGRLKRLVMGGIFAHRDDWIDYIKLHCPSLNSIYVPFLDSPARTQLLVHYGERLEYVLLDKFYDDEIRDVVAACSNARFDVSSTPDLDLSVSGLNLIGHTRLEGVILDCTDPEEMDDDLVEWTNAWNQCVNLRHLECQSAEVEDVQAIFATPKIHLTSIELKFNDSFVQEDVKKVMGVCANGTKIVEKFRCSGSSYSIDALDGFIEKNRASLRSISLPGKFADGNKKLDDLLKSFLQLPALEEIYVDYDIPQDILRSLRNNGVYCSRKLTY